MQNKIYIKIKDSKEESYTTLKELLKSEGLLNIYDTVARKMRHGKPFELGDITIKKIKLNHTKYNKR
jgi:hypothetical protein